MMNKYIDQLPIENITDMRAARGGDVNDAYKIYTEDDIYYMLVQTGADDEFYAGEIEGLRLFEANDITAPRVIASGVIEGDAYLVLSYLEEGIKGSQADLADLVAKMHSVHSPNDKFGFDLPHRGSATTFTNDWSDDWKVVFVEERMDKLRDQLVNMGLWSNYDVETYEKVREIMVAELERHKSNPVLLHGDLWGGNYMFLKDERPALFDPSPFYGEREFDIGVTTVFGGFTNEFYNRYNEILPMEDGYDLRLEFYRLYLFMVHLVKFGATYESSVDRSMDSIIHFR